MSTIKIPNPLIMHTNWASD